MMFVWEKVQWNWHAHANITLLNKMVWVYPWAQTHLQSWQRKSTLLWLSNDTTEMTMMVNLQVEVSTENKGNGFDTLSKKVDGLTQLQHFCSHASWGYILYLLSLSV